MNIKAALIVNRLLEAMDRRKFLRVLGGGIAGAAAAPAVMARAATSAAPAAAPAMATAVATEDPYWMVEFLMDYWGFSMEDNYGDVVKTMVRLSGGDEYSLGDLARTTEERFYDAIEQGLIQRDMPEGQLIDFAEQAAAESASEIEAAIRDIRSGRKNRRADWQEEYERKQKEKQPPPKQKTRTVYNSRRPEQDRRGMDQPRIPQQARPRFGEAQRMVDALLA